MKVVAKFKVGEIRRILTSVPKVDEQGKTSWGLGEVRSVLMSPVCGNGDPNHENTKFWQSSPSGHLELGCANLAAAEAFEIGKEYYIIFSDSI